MSEELKHSEVIRCMMEHLRNEKGHYRYTQRQVEEIIRVYVDSLISALGTGKSVHVRAFGIMKVRAERARKMTTSNYKYIRKCPFTLKVLVYLSASGVISLQKAVQLFNNFVDGKLHRKGLS